MLGAAATYQPAQCLRLPINSIRTARCLSLQRNKYACKQECRLLRRCPSAMSTSFTTLYAACKNTLQGNYNSPSRVTGSLLNSSRDLVCQSKHRMSSKMSFVSRKALPNILVYFVGVSDSTEQKSVLKSIDKTIDSIYGVNRFVVYSVQDTELAGNSRAYSASLLLVIHNDGEPTPEVTASKLPQLVLSFAHLYPNGIADHFDAHYFAEAIQKCIRKEEDKLLTRSNEEQLYADTAVYVFDSKRSYNAWLKMQIVDKKTNLIDFHPGESLPQQADPNDVFFIDWQRNDQTATVEGFNAKRFFNNLETNYLGRSLVFADRVSSTMKLATRFKQVNGIVAITNYQTAGIGRNANKWLSPKGCAMFTISLQLATSSALMAQLPLIQHLASLSVILALPSTELNVKIKWPNDILFAESMSKLAGILTRSYCYGSQINVQIGMGINVTNRQPSVCLDELIELYNSRLPADATRLELMPAETFIARILNNLERLIDMLTDDGTSRLAYLRKIKQMYVTNWVHSDALIEVRSGNGQEKVPAIQARICGIDDSGYLCAEDLKTGEFISLKPDGNRFDLMHNLVILNGSN